MFWQNTHLICFTECICEIETSFWKDAMYATLRLHCLYCSDFELITDDGTACLANVVFLFNRLWTTQLTQIIFPYGCERQTFKFIK